MTLLIISAIFYAVVIVGVIVCGRNWHDWNNPK